MFIALKSQKDFSVSGYKESRLDTSYPKVSSIHLFYQLSKDSNRVHDTNISGYCPQLSSHCGIISSVTSDSFDTFLINHNEIAIKVFCSLV